MSTYVMSFDSTMIMPSDCYYIWYKGLYMKYIKAINNSTGKQDIQHSDSLLTISEGYETEIWLKMSEFARAWAYANGVQIRVAPGLIINPSSLQNIGKIKNTFGSLRTQTLCQGTIKGGEFSHIVNIDTKDKAELLRLYTMADANPEIYFKILFFWHTLVYPSKNEENAISYINKTLSLIRLSAHEKNILFDGTFGLIKDNNVGEYICKRIRNAIAHIKRNSGISLALEDKQQNVHLSVVSNILKDIARYKLDHDYNFDQNAPIDICRLYNPSVEFSE